MISLDFSGKLVLVTGGGRGIGLAITRALAEAGADIAITYTTTDASPVASHLSTEYNVTIRAYPCDTSNSQQVDASITSIHAEFGKQVDIGICNAGISLWRDTHDMSDQELQTMFAVNAFGPIYTARALVRSWLDLPIPVPASEAGYTALSTFTASGASASTDNDKGNDAPPQPHRGPQPRPRLQLQGKQLLFVSSISGLVAMSPQHQAAYNGSKAALTMMAKSLAGEWAPLGISVNAISPGYVSTEMIANPPDKKAEMWVHEWQSRTPAGHFASAETLGRFIALLVSDRAGGSGFMTGSDIIMDGGERR